MLCFLWLGSIWVCLCVSGFWRLTGAYRGLVVLDAALCVACCLTCCRGEFGGALLLFVMVAIARVNALFGWVNVDGC